MTKLRLLSSYLLALLSVICGWVALPYVCTVQWGLKLSNKMVYFALNAVQQLLIFAVPALLILTARKERRARFFSECRRLRMDTIGGIALLAVSGTVVMALVASLWSVFLQRLWGCAGEATSLPKAEGFWQQLLALVSIALVPALSEELLFRALLQGTILRRWPVAGLWITAMIFASLHFRPDVLPALLLCGVALGWIYRKYGFWSSVLLHGLYNGVVQVLSGVEGGLVMVPICCLACWFSLWMLNRGEQTSCV